MRNAIAGLIALLAGVLGWCAVVSRRSDRDIAPKVTAFLVSLLPPVIGNLIIIIAHTEGFSLFGRYLYACGIDITMFCLLDFTLSYCGLKWKKHWRAVLQGVIALDIVQLLLNPFFGHAFTPDMMIAYGEPYYNVTSHLGRNLHLVLVYIMMGAILTILLVKAIRGAKIYSEKYSIMFLLLLFTGLWEIFYIFSRTPVKRSVIAYGVFGILVFYFSLYYRPRRLLDHLLADVASGLTDGLFLFDEKGDCVWADDHGYRLIGVRENDTDRVVEQLRALFPDLKIDQTAWNGRCSVGEKYYHLTKHTLYDARERALGSVLSVQDETENELALQHERYIANHDPLTGVYTKKHLFEETRARIDAQPEETFFVAYMDINDFKFINDVFGQEYGDYTLQAFAKDLREKLPPEALFGRIHGDAFGACFPGSVFDASMAETFASSFLIEKDAITHSVLVHQGVYEVRDRSLDVSVMYDRAKIALQTIKGDYKKHIAIYDNEMREKALRDQLIAIQIPAALKNREIYPYLQAIVDRDGKVIGAEALVRWIHPDKGFLSPADFIPVVEQNGMIADVDRAMWHRAGEILKRWEEAGREDLFISVNVSPKDFYFMDVVKELTAVAEECAISPSRLRVEITETVMMNDSAGRFDILRDLQAAGFIVEMDDFGSGYSSLNLLKNMPVDIIKIDMMFLSDMQTEARTPVILRNLINMMTELGLTPLTEGVETEEQYAALARMGCQLFQGYLFARPLPVAEFEKRFSIQEARK